MRVSLILFLTLFSDVDLVHQMIKEKTNKIEEVHNEVYGLQDRYKSQQLDRDDVVLRLTRENDEAMKKMIELEAKIQEHEKKNEKIQQDTINNYQAQTKKIEATAKE